MQINRLFEIIYILLDKKKVSATELADRFEVSTRTIYRDIDTLSSAGIPIYATKGKGGGISLMPDFVLNKTVLTDSEKREILASLHAVAAVNLSESETAINKLSTLFGNNNTDWLEVDFSLWYNFDKEADIFNALKAAIISKTIVSFDYISMKGEVLERKIEPLRLCFKGTARYLYGYCTLRRDFRFFKLSRIKNVKQTSETFDRVLNEPVLKSIAIIDEKYINLKLKLTQKVAFRVYDEFENYEQQEDGSYIAEINYPSDKDSIFLYLSSFGNECEILEPVALRTEYKNELLKIYKKYL